MRLIFMGTPVFAVPSLKALCKAAYDVTLVVTQPDRPRGRGKRVQPTPVKAAALELGLPIEQPASLRDAAVQERLASLKPDAICVVAYGALLPPPLITLGRFGCINVHPSLLPKYRGAAPIQRALMNGEEVTGVTTMFLSEEMDAGDIILQEAVPIGADEDAGALHDRLADIGARLLVESLQLLAEGKAPRIPQAHEEATYAPKIEPHDEVIVWERSARELHNQIRGLSPSPGAYTFYNGRRLKIRQARWSPENTEAPPGTVVEWDGEAIRVQTGDGILHLLRVQPENSEPRSARDFVNGYRITAGDRLGAP